MLQALTNRVPAPISSLFDIRQIEVMPWPVPYRFFHDCRRVLAPLRIETGTCSRSNYLLRPILRSGDPISSPKTDSSLASSPFSGQINGPECLPDGLSGRFSRSQPWKKSALPPAGEEKVDAGLFKFDSDGPIAMLSFTRHAIRVRTVKRGPQKPDFCKQAFRFMKFLNCFNMNLTNSNNRSAHKKNTSNT